MSLAYRAGCPLKDMEFVQYHPTGLPGTGILMTEASRGEGGYLTNKDGERYLERYLPEKMELGPRDIVSRAFVHEEQAGRVYEGKYGSYIHLDLRHLGEKVIDERIPFVRELAKNYVGIDPVYEPIPVRPVVHYMMGGVSTDINGKTPIEGLYAAGETACVSINGANRLGSNSLVECLVFGARAGLGAAQYTREQEFGSSGVLDQLVQFEELEMREKFSTDGSESIAGLRTELQTAMEKGAGIYRQESELSTACEAVATLRERYQNLRVEDNSEVYNTELISAIELGCMLDVAEAVANSAHKRQESRGSHARSDFESRDDDRFLNHSLAFWTEEGPQIDYAPVTITRWQPEERTY